MENLNKLINFIDKDYYEKNYYSLFKKEGTYLRYENNRIELSFNEFNSNSSFFYVIEYKNLPKYIKNLLASNNKYKIQLALNLL